MSKLISSEEITRIKSQLIWSESDKARILGHVERLEQLYSEKFGGSALTVIYLKQVSADAEAKLAEIIEAEKASNQG